MKNSFCSYKTLNEDLLKKIKVSTSEYSFYYNDVDEDNESVQITVEYEGLSQKNANMLMLSTKNSNYNSDIHNLIMNGSLFIDNPEYLFGPSGLADFESKIGVALFWFSKTSKQRGVEYLGEIVYGDSNVILPVFLGFLPKQIRGEINIQIMLYVKKSVNNQYFYMASQSGTMLGIIDEFTIMIDGSGSVFPIVTVNGGNSPLWSLEFNFVDPCEDRFDIEYLQICINKDHKLYPLLDMDDGGLSTSPLLREIIANALSMIIMKVKEDSQSWASMMNDEYKQGSICAAIKYFYDTFNWNYDSVYELSYSIRRRFDIMFK